jgi:hypothetical protein
VSDDEQLDPRIVAALRDLPAASNEIRDAHIAEALSHISPSVSQRSAQRSPRRWLAVAAALAVLVGGNALYASLSPSTDSTVSPRNSAVTTVPTKGSVCDAGLAGYTIVGTYSSAGSVREVWTSKQNLVVVDQTSCAQLGTITHPAIVASNNGCAGFSLGAGNQAVGTYSVAGTELTLVATPTELQIHGGSSCEVIASYPLPVGP